MQQNQQMNFVNKSVNLYKSRPVLLGENPKTMTFADRDHVEIVVLL